MNRKEEIKNICLDVLNNSKADHGEEGYCAEEIAHRLTVKGYLRYDQIGLDPEKTIQILSDVLNEFKNKHPFIINELKVESNE